MSKIGKLRQRLAMMFDLAGSRAPVTRNKWIDDAEVMANPKKYGLKPFTTDKPFKWNPPKDPEHEAWVKEQYDNFDKVVKDIKAYNEDVETEKNLQELLDTETESYESSVTRKPRKHRPKKPTQQDRIDVMEARLKQRIAQVRFAVTYGKGQSWLVSPDVINAFKNREPFRLHQKQKGRNAEYAFQTDGDTLFQLSKKEKGLPQKRYEIASWDDEENLNWSFEGRDSASTIQAGKMLGLALILCLVFGVLFHLCSEYEMRNHAQVVNLLHQALYRIHHM